MPTTVFDQQQAPRGGGGASSAAEVSYDGAASGLAAGNVQEATDAIWAKIRECLIWEGVS
jgi:hypothetical protein